MNFLDWKSVPDNSDDAHWLTKANFWLLAAKLLHDKRVPRFINLDLHDVRTAFARVAYHYDRDNPNPPKINGRLPFKHPRAVAIQFRYGFVVDDDGLKVIDVSEPERVRVIEGALVHLADARDVYVARTYAYVADGKDGVAIVDVKLPEQPRLDQMYQAEGKLNDARQVKVAMTNASLFAYVADGKNGLRILQLTSPETMSTYAGFSPRPAPQLIATFKTKGDALAVSKGLDRDRAVDESGNQIAVFGRRGARPFTFAEMQRMLRADEGRGQFFSVTDEPVTEPRNPKAAGIDSKAGASLTARIASANSSDILKSLLIGCILGALLVILSRWRIRSRRKGEVSTGRDSDRVSSPISLL